MNIKYIILLSVLFAILPISAKQKEYAGNMHITPIKFEQKGDSLYVTIKFDISGVNVDSHRSISLFPVIISQHQVMRLPEVIVKGRSNYQAYNRHIALMTESERILYNKTAPYAVVKGCKSKDLRSVEYNMVIPYEHWMADARMDIQEDLCGCGDAPRTLSMAQLINSVQREIIIETYTITPFLAYVNPKIESVKHRAMIGEVFLDFMVNKTNIRADYMNNPQELRKITDMITELKNDKNILVNAISVYGYASPEGSINSNKRLSEGRANALIDYIAPKFDYPRSHYNVHYAGENWQGLKDAVVKTEMSYKDEILRIIDTVPVWDVKNNISRNKLLMSLHNGEPYKYLLKEIYPTLRKAICKIDYVVKGFDVADAKTIITKRPQDLSLNEMFMVANTYEKGSQEFVDVFELAVRMYPNDATANLNATVAALSRNDLRSAERYIEQIKDKQNIPELDNARGVLALLKGDFELAEEYLKIAVEAGLIMARINLDELNKKRDNIKLLNKQRR